MKLVEQLLEVQKDLPSLVKDKTNSHFGNSYVTLNALMDAIVPHLNAHGLLLVQAPTHIDGTPALATTLICPETAEELASVTPLLVDKNNSQGLGSAITYMRRYALMSILGLVADEDDDGNAASKGVLVATSKDRKSVV